jgi:SAM-dependent methyltransferase
MIDAIEIDETAAAQGERTAGQEGRFVAACPSSPALQTTATIMVAVLDVIEHVEDDVAALKAMATALKPGGQILITVPAHQWMWSAHDVVNHHKRRYSKKRSLAALQKAGLGLKQQAALVQFACCSRWRSRRASSGKLTGKDDSDDSPPPKPLNSCVRSGLRAGAAFARPASDTAGAFDYRAGPAEGLGPCCRAPRLRRTRALRRCPRTDSPAGHGPSPGQ